MGHAVLNREIDHFTGATDHIGDGIRPLTLPDDFNCLAQRAALVGAHIPVDQRLIEMDMRLDEAGDGHPSGGVDGTFEGGRLRSILKNAVGNRDIPKFALAPQPGILDEQARHH